MWQGQQLSCRLAPARLSPAVCWWMRSPALCCPLRSFATVFLSHMCREYPRSNDLCMVSLLPTRKPIHTGFEERNELHKPSGTGPRYSCKRRASRGFQYTPWFCIFDSSAARRDFEGPKRSIIAEARGKISVILLLCQQNRILAAPSCKSAESRGAITWL